MAFKLIGVFVFATMLLASARPAEACSCVRIDGHEGIAADLLRYDAIIEGTVESISLGIRPWPSDWNVPPELAGNGREIHVVNLKDAKYLRGIAEAIVITAPQEAACGYRFHVGSRYVITASMKDGELTVSLCSLTRLSYQAEEIFEHIKRLPPPD